MCSLLLTLATPYLDAGLGPVWTLSEVDWWFASTEERRTGWMTRTALGFELGGADGGFAILVEPVSMETYHIGQSHGQRYGAMVGAATRF